MKCVSRGSWSEIYRRWKQETLLRRDALIGTHTARKIVPKWSTSVVSFADNLFKFAIQVNLQKMMVSCCNNGTFYGYLVNRCVSWGIDVLTVSNVVLLLNHKTTSITFLLLGRTWIEECNSFVSESRGCACGIHLIPPFFTFPISRLSGGQFWISHTKFCAEDGRPEMESTGLGPFWQLRKRFVQF